MNRYRAQRFDSMEALGSIRAQWEELLAQIPNPSNFNTYEWMSSWWHAYGSQRQVFALAVQDEQDRLAGLALFSIEDVRLRLGVHVRLLRLLGDGSTDSDNLQILARPGSEKEVVRLVLEVLQAEQAQWDIVKFSMVPDDSPATAEFHRQALALGWASYVKKHPWRVIVFSGSWQDYLHSLSYNERRNITRYRKRLESKFHVEYQRCAQKSDLPRFLEAFFEIHQKRWMRRGEPGTFAEPERRRLYAEVSHEFLRRGWLEFWLLSLDGRVAAAEYSFRFGSSVFCLQQGFDPDFLHLGVGNVLRGHVLEVLVGEGVRRYDFLGGGSKYKTRWYPQEFWYLNLYFARPFTLAATLLHSRERLLEVKEQLRRTLPAPAMSAYRAVKERIRGVKPDAAKHGGDHEHGDSRDD